MDRVLSFWRGLYWPVSPFPCQALLERPPTPDEQEEPAIPRHDKNLAAEEPTLGQTDESETSEATLQSTREVSASAFEDEPDAAKIVRIFHDFVTQSKLHFRQPPAKPHREAVPESNPNPNPTTEPRNPQLAYRLLETLTDTVTGKGLYLPLLDIEPLRSLTILPKPQLHHLTSHGIFIYCGQDHEIHPPGFTRGGTEPGPPWKTFSQSRQQGLLKFILASAHLDPGVCTSFLSGLLGRSDIYVSYTTPADTANATTNFPRQRNSLILHNLRGGRRVGNRIVGQQLVAPHRYYPVTEYRTADTLEELATEEWRVLRVANPPPGQANWTQWTAAGMSARVADAVPVDVSIVGRDWVNSVDLIGVVGEEATSARLGTWDGWV